MANNSYHGDSILALDTEEDYAVWVYPGYSFERPIFLYVWEIIVILTCLVNCIVIVVLMRSKMRNATNMILVAIAVSDSMTGLVTLPSYISVYQRFEPAVDYQSVTNNNANFLNTGNTTVMNNDASGSTTTLAMDYSTTAYDNTSLSSKGYTNVTNNGSFFQTSTIPTNTNIPDNETTSDLPELRPTTEDMAAFYEEYYGGYYQTNASGDSSSSQEGYNLDKDLCRYFMITKFFVSKAFHTISIWLTLFLGIQRFASVAYPFKAQEWFSIRNTVIACVVISICSPLIHIYHLIDEKAEDGYCKWSLNGADNSGITYLWTTFFLMYFIPCVSLVTFTVLFIISLRKDSSKIEHMGSGKKFFKKRASDHRRISIVVTAIVIVFLIPEVPYGLFLISTLIIKHAGHKDLSIETNRAIQATYELSLVLSFHANFYIYTLFNRKFRSTLKVTFLLPLYRLLGIEGRLSISRTSSHASSYSKAHQPMKHMLAASSNTKCTDSVIHASEAEHEIKPFVDHK